MCVCVLCLIFTICSLNCDQVVHVCCLYHLGILKKISSSSQKRETVEGASVCETMKWVSDFITKHLNLDILWRCPTTSLHHTRYHEQSDNKGEEQARKIKKSVTLENPQLSSF